MTVSLAVDPSVPSGRKPRLGYIASALYLNVHALYLHFKKKKKNFVHDFMVCLRHGCPTHQVCLCFPCRGSAPPDGSRQHAYKYHTEQ
jgi:hypothetical protein